MRVTASWANSHLGISKNQVKKLPGVRDLDAPARGFGLWADAGVTTYALKDVKQAAREQWVADHLAHPKSGRGGGEGPRRTCAGVGVCADPAHGGWGGVHTGEGSGGPLLWSGGREAHRIVAFAGVGRGK